MLRPIDPSIVLESSGEKVAEAYPISADKDTDDGGVIFLRTHLPSVIRRASRSTMWVLYYLKKKGSIPTSGP